MTIEPALSIDGGGAIAPVAELVGVGKRYHSADTEVEVLRHVDFAIAPSEAVAIKGVSGSGKSTLLHILGAVEAASSGTVRVAGHDTGRLDARTQTAFRARNIGFVFQFFNLIPTLTALENVIAALEPLGGQRRGRRQAAADALAAVGLGEHREKYPSQLSGGQQQRVAIARAFVKRPPLLLADEPTGALDADTARQVLELLRAVQRETGSALVLATHDPLVCDYADRVLRMRDGRLEADT